MQKALVLTSGGLDSTTCLYYAIHKCGAENVYALNMFYGQKHDIEIQVARKIADKVLLRDHYFELDVSKVMSFNKDCSALLRGSNKEIAHESYKEQLAHTAVVSAYVPYRNGLFLSIAASIAYQLACDSVLYGAHADDAVKRANGGAAYPDCTEEFIKAQGGAIHEGTAGRVELVAPIWDKTKAEVVAFGLQYGMTRADFEMTHSCYEGVPGGCGTCGTCRDRQAALDTWEVTRGCGQSGIPRKL